MTCGGCQYLGRNCGGVEGDPGTHTVDPLSLTSRQLVSLACAVARVGTVICDLGKVDAGGPPAAVEEPYIWDTKED